MTSEDQHGLIRAFQSRYQRFPDVRSSAPGRVNLIGEHTDYNHGYVLPAAIDRRIYFLAAGRRDGRVILWSENFEEESRFELEEFSPSTRHPWSNYVRGVVKALQDGGFTLSGFDGWLWGDVPLGAGLSSSAALEVSVLTGINSLLGLDIGRERIARLGQQAENEFVGVQCGLMDQFISVFGEEDSAVFLDCVTLEHDVIPLDFKRYEKTLFIYDTRVKRELAGSAYNLRREEAAAALQALRENGELTYREITADRLRRDRSRMSDRVFRRARHVVTENDRVLAAVAALRAADFSGLGELLFRSHESLRDDYEVSCPELDLLYDCGRRFEGCLGARMTGAGFGGSGIAVVEEDSSDEFKDMIKKESARLGFTEPVFHDVAVDGGAQALLRE